MMLKAEVNQVNIISPLPLTISSQFLCEPSEKYDRSELADESDTDIIFYTYSSNLSINRLNSWN